VTCDARGRALEGTEGTLVWPDYLSASELDSLVVEGDGLEPLRFVLWWSDDDSFTPERSLASAAQDWSLAAVARNGALEPAARDEPAAADYRLGDRGAEVVRFDLSRAPEWQGRVRRFRLAWSGTPPPDGRILGAWAMKRLPPS
jgi:hypothetical protein